MSSHLHLFVLLYALSHADACSLQLASLLALFPVPLSAIISCMMNSRSGSSILLFIMQLIIAGRGTGNEATSLSRDQTLVHTSYINETICPCRLACPYKLLPIQNFNLTSACATLNNLEESENKFNNDPCLNIVYNDVMLNLLLIYCHPYAI